MDEEFVFTTFTLPAPTKKRLEEEAKRQDRSLSSVLRAAVSCYLDHLDRAGKGNTSDPGSKDRG